VGRVVGLDTLLAELEASPGRVVTTNGCFDLLHVGHLTLLRQAKGLGDTLVVAVNDDASVRRLGKDPCSPVVPADERAELVAALDPVDYVVVFTEDTPERVLAAIRPAVHVKGGDYRPEDLPETRVVEEGGGEVVIVPLVPDHSTTALVSRIRC
jgi:rfaE bifunctional protein nucleotidyltransferase chain/domain